MTSSPTKVLITGVRGLVAGAVLADLRRQPERYEVHGVDPIPSPWTYRDRVAGRALPQDRLRIADLSDTYALRRAVEGMDVVVHFGDEGGQDWMGSPAHDSVRTSGIFEACRHGKVKRVICASSAMTCWGYSKREPYCSIREGRFEDLPAAIPMITKNSPPHPSGSHGLAKLKEEALGRVFSDVYGISVRFLRFGWINEQDLPWDPHLASVWCSQRDAAQLVKKSIDEPTNRKFQVFFGISANLRRWLDIDDAADQIGFVPKDRAEDHLDPSGIPFAAAC